MAAFHKNTWLQTKIGYFRLGDLWDFQPNTIETWNGHEWAENTLELELVWEKHITCFTDGSMLIGSMTLDSSTNPKSLPPNPDRTDLFPCRDMYTLGKDISLGITHFDGVPDFVMCAPEKGVQSFYTGLHFCGRNNSQLIYHDNPQMIRDMQVLFQTYRPSVISQNLLGFLSEHEVVQIRDSTVEKCSMPETFIRVKNPCYLNTYWFNGSVP